MNHANVLTESEKKHKEEFEKKVENVKQHLKAAMEESSMIPAEYEGMMGMDLQDERRTKG